MIELRPYQKDVSNKALSILDSLKIVYLAMEVRTGKTLTALNVANLYGAKKVIFLTKKKAIKDIEGDYDKLNPNFEITVINNESLHKVENTKSYDFVISDEHHRNGAYPKPNKTTKLIKSLFSKLPMIFLSGTPHPESYSQIYHQFWVSDFSPFKEKTFYKWAKNYVNVEKKQLGYAIVNDYSKGIKDKITPIIEPYMIRFSQKQAGFKTEIQEEVLEVGMKESTYNLAKALQKDKLYVSPKDEKTVIADTAVKMQQKLHQIFSGTVLTEYNEKVIFDTSKADFIKEKFKNKRIGIFYKFRAEWDLIKQTFGTDVCDNLDDFNNGCKNIALQIVSGSEGISLREADYLVYFNIDFSAKNYWQSRDRMTTMDRKFNKIYWIFSKNGIESKIYKAVKNKKSYTTDIFKKDYGVSKGSYKRHGEQGVFGFKDY